MPLFPSSSRHFLPISLPNLAAFRKDWDDDGFEPCRDDFCGTKLLGQSIEPVHGLVHGAGISRCSFDPDTPERFADVPYRRLRGQHASRHPLNERKNDHVPCANRMSTCQSKSFSLILPRPIDSMYNNTTGVEMESGRESSYEILRSGMLLMKNYLTLSQQVEIVDRCEELGVGPGGFYQPGLKNGSKLRLQRMCLGRNWDPDARYYKERRFRSTEAPPPIPDELIRMVKEVLQASQSLLVNLEHEQLPLMSPDVCLVNFLTTSCGLGVHQDRSESSYSFRVGLPMVSISIGDSVDFLYSVSGDVDNASKTLLESGDVLIFGGNPRLVYHGVKTIIPNSAPRPLLEQTMLRPGRLNLTFREF
ncbi:hypothetical protein OSB04_020529 [Centaurea solstitialis]|uniref:Alpha-ketoglutarate-dependent dioxygenase AlkB-like domain-containing protein n=1 Tax=Centaurea solstitialis TaxID=347529 RepID=A0AA38WGX4_9ASTR|nr:hypothetical protein OSB04_020529 [Centaurea solstitialis]